MAGGISVGQLLQMKPMARAQAIQALQNRTRLKLIDLAQYGQDRALNEAAKYGQLIHELTVGEIDG